MTVTLKSMHVLNALHLYILLWFAHNQSNLIFKVVMTDISQNLAMFILIQCYFENSFIILSLYFTKYFFYYATSDGYAQF